MWRRNPARAAVAAPRVEPLRARFTADASRSDPGGWPKRPRLGAAWALHPRVRGLAGRDPLRRGAGTHPAVRPWPGHMRPPAPHAGAPPGGGWARGPRHDAARPARQRSSHDLLSPSPREGSLGGSVRTFLGPAWTGRPGWRLGRRPSSLRTGPGRARDAHHARTLPEQRSSPRRHAHRTPCPRRGCRFPERARCASTRQGIQSCGQGYRCRRKRSNNAKPGAPCLMRHRLPVEPVG